jgi:MFS transporter, OFA family, oxalate/formate antiporter
MTRWIVLAAGVVLQMILGGIYAWSAFVPPLVEGYGLTRGQCGMIFGMTIAVFSIAMIPAGRLLQSRGPRLTAAIGALLFSWGYLLAAYSGGNYFLMLLGLGVITGAGIGFGYVCPLTTGMKWFPNHRGLVTGVAVAGFGGGAILLSNLAEYLLYHVNMDVLGVFQLVGLLFGGVALLSALFMSEPGKVETVGIRMVVSSSRVHLYSPYFWLVSLGLFAGTFAGLLVVSNLKPMMLSVGLDEKSATLSISLFAIGNVIGRIFWGRVHDRYGSRRTILLSLASLGLSMVLLLVGGPAWGILLLTLIIGAGFGGCFVVYASSIVDFFSVTLFPKLYPIAFLFYGLAALIGPPLGGWIADRTGSYASGVVVSITIIGLALVVIRVSTGRYPAPVAEEIQG